MRSIAKKNVVLLLIFASSVALLVIFQAVVFTNQRAVLFDTVPRNQFEAWERIQEHRKRVASDACAKFSRDTEDQRRHVFEALRMDENHRLLYCPVPKIASSVWKVVLLMLTGKVDSSADPSDQKYSTALAKTLPELKHLEVSDATRRFRSYTKFMFTRHPFERVLSAYRNKMMHNTPDKDFFHKQYGTEIIRRYRENPSEESLREGNDVRFEEFVRYIIDKYNTNGTYALDPHWRPVVDICRPCSIGFDVIGKFETIDLDADYIMELGRTDFDFPKSSRSKRTHNLMQKYFKGISQRDIEGLYKVYEKDFEVFEYEKMPSY